MKKIYIILLIILASFQVAKSQESYWGIKGGMNVADLGGKELGYVTKLSWHAGGVGEFVLTPFISLQVELIYSNQGAVTDNTREVRLNYHYTNLPVLAKIYFLEDASFELGMQYGYLIKAVKRTPQYTEILTSVTRNDFSAVFGLAYDLGETVVFELRYNMGISDTRGANIIYEQRVTNRVLQISVGFLF